MFKITDVKILPNYKIWLRFADGKSGEADLSHLAGKGVFSDWKDYGAFEKVHIGERGELVWKNNVDLCPDSLYLQATKKTPEQVFPNLTVHA